MDAVDGELEIEVLGPDREVMLESNPIRGDFPRLAVEWHEGNLVDLMGCDRTLRFNMRNADLYSFWLE